MRITAPRRGFPRRMREAGRVAADAVGWGFSASAAGSRCTGRGKPASELCARRSAGDGAKSGLAGANSGARARKSVGDGTGGRGARDARQMGERWCRGWAGAAATSRGTGGLMRRNRPRSK